MKLDLGVRSQEQEGESDNGGGKVMLGLVTVSLKLLFYVNKENSAESLTGLSLGSIRPNCGPPVCGLNAPGCSRSFLPSVGC